MQLSMNGKSIRLFFDSNFKMFIAVGLTGLEPVTPALSRRCSNQLSYRPIYVGWRVSRLESGGMGIRTPDIQLAKLALYQLSYTPDELKQKAK